MLHKKDNIRNSGRKVVVIGLDGATFDILDPLCQKGKLPNIARLIKKGARGTLMSTMPPVTGPAWVSFMTGKNPGKHGVFDFVKAMGNDVRRRIISQRDIKAKTLWSILSENDKKIGVINVPVTYPPPEVNGFLISGMLTPNLDTEFTYPSSLYRELTDEIGEYVLDVWWEPYGERGVKEFLQRLMFCTIQRAKASLYLMESRKSDFFMTVFTGTDRLQHSLWDVIFREVTDSPPRSSNEQEIRDLIVKYYQTIDTYIGRFADIAGEDTNIVIISDHGFGHLKKEFYVNKWLEDLGFLHFDRKRLGRLNLMNKATAAIRTIDVLKLRRKVFGRLQKRPARMRAYDFLENIRWSETKAYAVSNTEQGIYINVYGREPLGTVKPGRELEEMKALIMERLKDLRDPETNEKVLSWTMKGEDVYTGPYAKDAPDIMFVLKEGEYVAIAQPMNKVFEEAHWKTGRGGHRMEGVFVACGKGIRNGMEAKGCRIIDIAPTILNMMGVPIPGDMDGNVLHDIFTEGFKKANPPLYTEPSEDAPSDTGEHEVYSEEEAAEIEKKLRGLGYIG